MKTEELEEVVQIVADAGGRIVGRTRLQKIGYLLTATGYSRVFDFEYKHYGPFSEALAESTQVAELFGMLEEEEKSTAWGGSYFVVKSGDGSAPSSDAGRVRLVKLASAADAVELELAATAVFLAKEGFKDPWGETARRKPDKSENGRLEKAKVLYKSLCSVHVHEPLPAIL